MGSRFIYPVDTDQFAIIREQGKFYVDKTDMVFDLVRRYNYVFLSRPRRFGKSLLCNTFKAYFEGRRELFDGLAIAALEKDWKPYPVMHFIISGLKSLPIEEARSKLGNMLSDYEKLYGADPDEKSPGARFRGIIHRAHARCGERVVVLIDEYDAPIMRLLYEKEKMAEMRTMLREFYQVLKDEGEHLRFVFLTGITRFSQLSIFSELNNLMNISMLPEYSGLCGFTKKELDTVLRPCVEDFAVQYGCTTDEAYSLLQKQYDGYHFCDGGEDIYAPFSLLKALNNGEIGDYWFTGATPTTLIEHLKHYPLRNAIDYDGAQVGLDEFDIPCEDASTPLPLLYQSGYLSIASYSRRIKTYTLRFPNMEVRNGMIKCLMPLIMRRTTGDSNSLVRRMTESLFEGSISRALQHLRAYIAGIPYDVITKQEWDDRQSRESFYKMLLYMVFSIINDNVDCEVKSMLGRADVVIRTDTDVFVVELKVDGTVGEALAQIEDKGYAVPWSADGRRVFKCGAVIDSACRNIARWRVMDEAGRTVEDWAAPVGISSDLLCGRTQCL